LEKRYIKVEQQYFSEKYFTGEIRLVMSLMEEGDWFDIHGTVYFGDFKVSFIRLRNNILNNIREYILPDGTIAILPEVWFSRYRDLARLGNVTGESISLKRHHFALAKEVASHVESNLPIDYEALMQNRNLDGVKIPDGLSAKLRPYQAEGFQWMLIMQQLGLGGCLADDMGLGKTLQTLVMLMQSKRQTSESPDISLQEASIRQLNLFSPNFGGEAIHRRTSLIAMPLSLIHNWVNEIVKFSPGLRTYVHSGQDRVQDPRIFLDYDVILTTYGIIRNDLEMFRQMEFWYIILDESQLIKNPQSKLFRAVKQLKSKHRLVLTGTPIENSLVDLWAQLSFLNDGLLGNLSYFKEEYAVPIEKSRSTQQEEKLQKIIGPFILRRTKEMVARDLPSLTEQIYYCEMSEEQKSLYDEKKSEIRNLILDNISRMGTDKSRFVILKGLMQLRLLSNHPLLYTGENSEQMKGKAIPSGKFEEVVRNLENLKAEGHKVLIYSQFVKHLRLFKEYFEKNGHDYSILTGQTINEERQKVIREFQEDPKKNFFLITLKAGGVGLNLTAAEYVFLLDPWWNPAVENQAISRAHRIGQEKKVFSYKFITRDSIEEKIMQLQSRKSDLASLFINNNNPLRFFTKETIVKLME
jgi:SNF2 family DNA or RNA helicase